MGGGAVAGVVEGYEREAPAERLRALEAEREGLRREVARLWERVRVLEEARAREMAMHQEAVRELEEKVRACNRVIVQQQEELNALRGRKRGKAPLENDD